MKELEGLRPITVRELLEMNENKYDEIITFIWKDENFRGGTLGLFNLEIEEVDNKLYDLRWSTLEGDPDLNNMEIDEPLNKVGYDSTWKYGLFTEI